VILASVSLYLFLVSLSCPLSLSRTHLPARNETGAICIVLGVIQIAASCAGAAEDTDGSAASSDSMVGVATDSPYSNMGAAQ
jgi:hypothetical protein